ncbi:MAG: Divalent-cation tolerance protein CutA [Rhodocyclaceae bacterium]|nr:MAG: divalent-cation tolerance protein CutA [Rhodocyclaceae bacterium]MBE7423452.1 divalent-cation tolerance protein CutA [Zoogloeaceae bacterium]MBV6408932.1 Divalent-cation tolerance protein CutA [Rhodocyclaceae bacterium]MCK6383261.1 divalent-cation tolerance protein CutA [Rhodocyclaceae bacterium]CAG0946338.1 Divalent-cation tolerance protein CutA [Gammaproteobacteria bacterium]
MEALLVITTLPDAETARALAGRLVERRLVACANILAPCQSLYHWKGRLEEAEEVPLLMKTSAARYPALEEAIRDYHPYELPEIVAVRIDKGLPAYLAWVAEETAAE